MQPAFKLTSPETGTVYWIYVEVPETRQSEDGGHKTAPLSGSPGAGIQSSDLRPLYSGTLLFLDGDDQFAAGAAAYRELSAETKMPPLLLVGVGYGGSYTSPVNRRGRDYTPPGIVMSRRAAERRLSSSSSQRRSGRSSSGAIR